MKKVLFQIVLVVLFSASTIYNQTLMDYVSAVKGDTLVIKDYYDMNNQPNSLYYALSLDTVDIPAGRVYELKANGYYSYYYPPSSPANHNTVITGPVSGMVMNNHTTKLSPPVICHELAEITIAPAGINAKGNLTIKNCELVPANIAGGIGWEISHTNNPNLNLVYDNCLFEHTLWVFVYSEYANCSFTFRNCYFVNMSGYPCRRNGGVLYCADNQDSLVVENCTHIMAQGNMYNFGGNLFNRTIINHNTFINCAGLIFSNSDFSYNVGLTNNLSLTNNIFVNCNIHPFDSCKIPDSGDEDQPRGIVNLYYADTTDATRIKFLVQNNLAYWDPSLANCDSILNVNRINGSICWEPQMIVMTSETQNMFDDDTNYPYLVTDTWKNAMPHFTDPKNLFTTQLVNIKDFVIGAADDTKYFVLPDWRLINTDPKNFINPDWPIPIDLSYNDADVLTGGIGSFPLGDLNWFPTKKAEWLAQRTTEYDKINDALNTGNLVTDVHNQGNLPVEFQLHQNYPNPFNPITTITFSLPKSANTSLKIFDILGREVEILVDGYITLGTHEAKFNAANLASGVYFYKLTSGNFTEIKKMVLMQ